MQNLEGMGGTEGGVSKPFPTEINAEGDEKDKLQEQKVPLIQQIN